MRSWMKQVVGENVETRDLNDIGKWSTERLDLLRSCGKHYARYTVDALNRMDKIIGCHLCGTAEGRGTRAIASSHELAAEELIRKIFPGERLFTQVHHVRKRLGPSDFMVEVTTPKGLKQYLLVEVDGEQHDHGYYHTTSADEQLCIDIEKDQKAQEQKICLARLHYKSRVQWSTTLRAAHTYLQHQRRKPFALYSWHHKQKKKKT